MDLAGLCRAAFRSALSVLGKSHVWGCVKSCQEAVTFTKNGTPLATGVLVEPGVVQLAVSRLEGR